LAARSSSSFSASSFRPHSASSASAVLQPCRHFPGISNPASRHQLVPLGFPALPCVTNSLYWGFQPCLASPTRSTRGLQPCLASPTRSTRGFQPCLASPTRSTGVSSPASRHQLVLLGFQPCLASPTRSSGVELFSPASRHQLPPCSPGIELRVSGCCCCLCLVVLPLMSWHLSLFVIVLTDREWACVLL
jgi:hypothetical protein